MKKMGGILILLLYCLSNAMGSAFAQEDLLLVQKVKNLEVAMTERDHEIAEMKKMILDLSQTVEAFRKTSPQAAADQAVPLVTEPAEAQAPSNEVLEKTKLARRKIENKKIRAAIAEEKKKGVVVGASGTGVLQQIVDSKN